MARTPTPADTRPTRRRRKLWWLLGGGAVALFVGIVGVPWIYINIIRDDPPPRLTFDNLDASRTTQVGDAAVTTADGSSDASPASDPDAAPTGAVTYRVVQPSTAGYRVKEVLNGQSAEAVGRTTAVEGTITAQGLTVTGAEIDVDLTQIASDSSRRDAQFQGRIMSTDEFPVAVFTLRGPITLAALPGADVTTTLVPGTLSLRGTDREVELEVAARRTGDDVELQGSLEIVFADYGIPDPSIGPVRTEDRGLLEFVITVAPAS
jgi:polyisoprenoid-binding protein YceI